MTGFSLPNWFVIPNLLPTTEHGKPPMLTTCPHKTYLNAVHASPFWLTWRSFSKRMAHQNSVCIPGFPIPRDMFNPSPSLFLYPRCTFWPISPKFRALYTQLFPTWNVLLSPLFSGYSSKCFPDILTSFLPIHNKWVENYFTSIYTYGRTYIRTL